MAHKGLQLDELNKILWEQGRPPIREQDLVTPTVATSIADATFQIKEQTKVENKPNETPMHAARSEVKSEVKSEAKQGKSKVKSETVSDDEPEKVKQYAANTIPKYTFIPSKSGKKENADETYTRVMQYIESDEDKYTFKDIETGNITTIDSSVAKDLDLQIDPGAFVKVTYDGNKAINIVPHEKIGIFQSLMKSSKQSTKNLKGKIKSIPKSIKSNISTSIKSSLYDIPIIGGILERSDIIRKKNKAELEGLQDYLTDQKEQESETKDDTKEQKQGQKNKPKRSSKRDDNSLVILLTQISKIVKDIKDMMSAEFASRDKNLDLKTKEPWDENKHPKDEKDFIKKKSGSSFIDLFLEGGLLIGLKKIGSSLTSIFGMITKVAGLIPGLPVALAVAATALISYKIGEWINENVPYLKKGNLGKDIYDIAHSDKWGVHKIVDQNTANSMDMGITPRPGESEESRLHRYNQFKKEQKEKLNEPVPVSTPSLSSIAPSSQSPDTTQPDTSQSSETEVNDSVTPSSSTGTSILKSVSQNNLKSSESSSSIMSNPNNESGNKLESGLQDVNTSKRQRNSESPIVIDKSSSESTDSTSASERSIPNPRTTNSDSLLADCRYIT